MEIDKTIYFDKKKQKELGKITEILRGWGLEELYGENLSLIACEAVLNSNFRRTIKAVNNAGEDKRIVDSSECRTILAAYGYRCSFYSDISHLRITHRNRYYPAVDAEKIIEESVTISPLSEAGELCYDSTIVRSVKLTGLSSFVSSSVSINTVTHQVRKNGKSINISETEYEELGKAKVMK